MSSLNIKETKEFNATKENLEPVQEFVLDTLKDCDLSIKIKNQFLIVIEEIFVNIASYSYETIGKCEVSVSFDDGTVSIAFKDNGKPFNPLAKDDPDIMLEAEERGIGGLGIFMVKNIMDDVRYDFIDGFNILTLVKKII